METKSISQIDRSKIIGGSDIAAAMGLSRWKSPLALWAEKTGKIKDDPLSNFEAKEIGTELEEYVALKFERKTGLRLRRDYRTFQHPKYPYLVGHIDRIVLDGESIFEAKTTGAWMARDWVGEDIPQEYVLQVTWYLGLSQRQRGWIAVLIGGQKFLYKEIGFDQELFDRMVESGRVFMEEFVLKDVPPVAGQDDQETVAKLFPESHERTVFFDGKRAEEINALVEERNGGIRTANDMQTRLDGIEARIKQLIGEAGEGETDLYRLSWKSQTRVGVDSVKLKDAGLFNQYAKTTSYRVLRTKTKEV